MLLVSWNVVTPCVHREITGPKPNSSISSLLSLLLPVLSNLFACTSESKQLEQSCECPYSAAYQCSCLNLPLIAIFLTDQALTLSTYKTLIWKGCTLLPPCSFNNLWKILQTSEITKTIPCHFICTTDKWCQVVYYTVVHV